MAILRECDRIRMIEVELSRNRLHVVGERVVIPRIEHHRLPAARILPDELVTGDDRVRRPTVCGQIEMTRGVGQKERAGVSAVGVRELPQLVTIQI
jgi:hypothetical protein